MAQLPKLLGHFDTEDLAGAGELGQGGRVGEQNGGERGIIHVDVTVGAKELLVLVDGPVIKVLSLSFLPLSLLLLPLLLSLLLLTQVTALSR